ncbi:hypothetical protein R3P38DRAFT_3343954 [Favolaschia claudopus]|uniref:Uncharacterized protein n=1 Tax=Favolaschia claudopus TaxID=2862362 RepID=A0AAW0DLI8_9AGAR
MNSKNEYGCITKGSGQSAARTDENENNGMTERATYEEGGRGRSGRQDRVKYCRSQTRAYHRRALKLGPGLRVEVRRSGVPWLDDGTQRRRRDEYVKKKGEGDGVGRGKTDEVCQDEDDMVAVAFRMSAPERKKRDKKTSKKDKKVKEVDGECMDRGSERVLCNAEEGPGEPRRFEMDDGHGRSRAIAKTGTGTGVRKPGRADIGAEIAGMVAWRTGEGPVNGSQRGWQLDVEAERNTPETASEKMLHSRMQVADTDIETSCFRLVWLQFKWTALSRGFESHRLLLESIRGCRWIGATMELEGVKSWSNLGQIDRVDVSKNSRCVKTKELSATRNGGDNRDACRDDDEGEQLGENECVNNYVKSLLISFPRFLNLPSSFILAFHSQSALQIPFSVILAIHPAWNLQASFPFTWSAAGPPPNFLSNGSKYYPGFDSPRPNSSESLNPLSRDLWAPIFRSRFSERCSTWLDCPPLRLSRIIQYLGVQFPASKCVFERRFFSA